MLNTTARGAEEERDAREDNRDVKKNVFVFDSLAMHTTHHITQSQLVTSDGLSPPMSAQFKNLSDSNEAKSE